MATLCPVMVCVATDKGEKKKERGINREQRGDRHQARDVLLTFPKVPSAISPMTVYSPSFEAGNSVGLSLIWKRRQRCRRRRLRCRCRWSLVSAVKKDLLWSWPMLVELRRRLGSIP